MTKAKGVSLAELEAIQRAEQRKGRPRFTADDERRHALLVLAQVAQLSQVERARVLRRAIRINEI